MNIALCNGKGGTGKTTLSVLLAQAIAQAGRRVALLDLDPQHTASRWLAEASGGVEVYSRGQTYDAVLIDTPPRLDTLRAALPSVEIALLVSSPSPADLWTTQATAEEVRPLLGRGGRLRVIFNNVQNGTVLARDLSTMAERIGVPALRSAISRRQAYQHAALLGWRALDASARDELCAAAVEILTK